MHIQLVRPGRDRAGRSTPDWPALEREWRTLEDTADGSLFQSWTWLGRRVAERFSDPWLVRATVAGQVAGLALFNRTGPRLARTLWLHETGRRDEDCVFVEHNGPLLARGHEGLLQPMLAVAARHGKLVLSGVDDAVLQAAQTLGHCHVTVTRQAPFARLDQLQDGSAWLDSLSASTRYRLRRSHRSYGKTGSLLVQPATNLAEALAFLDALAVLHQTRWTARGQPGAFAEPAFLDFHRELVACALPRGEVELLRISVANGANLQILGYLYNLRWRDEIYAYQAGFDYATADPHQLPGLTCHHLAIEAAIASRIRAYDFLAGESQYKTSLGNASCRMHWLELVRLGTAHDLLYRVRAILRRGRNMSRTEAAAPSRSPTLGTEHSDMQQARLPWPAATATIGMLSLLAWVAVGYLLHWMFRG